MHILTELASSFGFVRVFMQRESSLQSRAHSLVHPYTNLDGMKFIFIQEDGAALWAHNNMVPAASGTHADGTNGVPLSPFSIGKAPLECTPDKFTDIYHHMGNINSIKSFLWLKI